MGVIFTQGSFTRPLQKLLPTDTAAYIGLLSAHGDDDDNDSDDDDDDDDDDDAYDDNDHKRLHHHHHRSCNDIV